MSVRNITSSSNPDIRRLKALRDRRNVRRTERLFVVEGPRFVRDAITVQRPEQLVLSETAARVWHEELPPDLDVIIVPDLVFAEVSATLTPQGVLGVFQMSTGQPPRPAPLLTVVADGIQDPGNLGTMIRSAAANGASQILCTPGTVDPYNPKVVRAAAGAHFLLPIHFSERLELDLDGSAIYSAEGGAGTPIDKVDWTVPSSVLIGSEARGAGSLGVSLQATVVTIPMVNGVESLNAGVAASIILYEASRQHRQRERAEAAFRH